MKCNTGLTAKSQQITSLIGHEADITTLFCTAGKRRIYEIKELFSQTL